MRRPTHPLSIVFLLCVATIFWSSNGGPDLRRFPVLAFIWSQRWWVLSAATVVAVIAHVLVQRRHICPACGKRGFTRVVWHGGDSDATNDPWYGVRFCRSCGIRRVECERGVETLPAEGWHYTAGRYARREDGPPPPPQCRACGYDLRATPDRCPECGTIPAEDSTAAQTPKGGL